MHARSAILCCISAGVAACQAVQPIQPDQSWPHGPVLALPGNERAQADVTLECGTNSGPDCYQPNAPSVPKDAKELAAVKQTLPLPPPPPYKGLRARIVGTPPNEQFECIATVWNFNDDDARDVRLTILLPLEVAVNETHIACSPYGPTDPWLPAPTSGYCVSNNAAPVGCDVKTNGTVGSGTYGDGSVACSLGNITQRQNGTAYSIVRVRTTLPLQIPSGAPRTSKDSSWSCAAFVSSNTADPNRNNNFAVSNEARGPTPP